jgi:hypothetical protein
MGFNVVVYDALTKDFKEAFHKQYAELFSTRRGDRKKTSNKRWAD